MLKAQLSAFSGPSEPPKRWIHPCKCTLIAHEDCLLEWIRISETNPDQKTASLRRCPQCKEKYTIISEYPFALRTLDRVRLVAATGGQMILLCTFAAGCASACAGIYICLTGYGAHAVGKFIGQEMYELLIGNDPEKWPIAAFLTFPLVPLSLVLNRVSRFRGSISLYQVLGFCPAIHPQETFGASFASLFTDLKTMTRRLSQVKAPASASQILGDVWKDTLFSWPPSPALFGPGLTFVPMFYRRLMARFQKYVLGDSQDEAEVDDSPLLEININDDGDAEDVPQAQPNQPPQNQGEDGARVAVDGDEGAAVVAQAQIGAAAQEQQPANAAAVPNALPNGVNERDRNDGRGLRLRMTAARMGMVFGGALLCPTVASIAGSVLLRLALPSYPRSHYTLDFSGYSLYHPKRLLCAFLGVKPPGSAVRQSVFDMYPMSDYMGIFERLRVTLALSCRVVMVGTPTWTSADPVWYELIPHSLSHVADTKLSLTGGAILSVSALSP